jgi:hypothetical protein
MATVVGATINYNDYGLTESQWVQTAQQLDTYLSSDDGTLRPMAQTFGKFFFQEGVFGGVPTGMAQLAGAGTGWRALACMKPGRAGFSGTPDPTGSYGHDTYTNTQFAEFAACLATLKANGIYPDVCLWQEPNDGFFPSAEAYWDYVAFYAPAVTAAGLNLVYVGGASDMDSCIAYYPGDGYNGADYTWYAICCDFYDHDYQSGGRVDDLASLATTEGKKFGVTEFGNNHVSLTEADWAAFISYLTGLFTSREAAGLPNYAVIFWNTNLGDDTYTCVVGYAPDDDRAPPSDWKVPYLQQLYDTLTSTAAAAPYDVCNGTQAAGSAVFQVTVGTGAEGSPRSTSGGDLVAVALNAAAAGQSVVSVFDSQGNQYYPVNGYSGGSAQNHWLWVSLTDVPLISGLDVITVTFALSTGSKGLIARGCSDILSATPDQAVVAHASNGSPSSGPTQGLAQLQEWVIGVIGNNSNGGAPADVSFGTAETINPGNYLTVFDEITDAVSPVTASAMITSATWSASVTTFLYGAPSPPPQPPDGGNQPVMAPYFPPGYDPADSDFDTWIQAPLTFLTRKVVFRAQLTTALAFPAGENTLIPYNGIFEDVYGGWDAATSSWLCPQGMSGTYRISVTAAANHATDAVSTLQPAIALNGSLVYTADNTWVPQTQPGIASGSTEVSLAGGQDAVSAYAWWNGNSAGSASTAVGQRCLIQIAWVQL